MASVYEQCTAWLRENWDPDLVVAEWWQRLADSGWAVPTWPEEWYGKGLSRGEQTEVRQAFSDVKALGAPAGLGIMLAGPTILTHGNDEQKARYLRPIVSGEVAWCQLFSEPGAGSDLASLQTKAVKDGDEWVVNGQKVWTSGGHVSQMGMLIARTNPDAPKHEGITWFAIEMDQPGIEVVPLREMTGRALFNEVFLSDARARDDAMIGGLNQGWAVANTTLTNERIGLGGGGGAAGAAAGPKGGALQRRAGDLIRSGDGSGTSQALAGRGYGTLAKLAEEFGKAGQPTIRQDLAQLYTLEQISRYTQLRAKSAKRPGPEVSTGKLQVSRITRLSREVGLAILGPHGTLHGADAPHRGMIQEMALFSPAPSIYGGSDEIQKNIIGERVLGLPKEPSADKGVAFKDLKVGTQR